MPCVLCKILSLQDLSHSIARNMAAIRLQLLTLIRH